MPGPFGIYSVLLPIPQFFLLFLLNLFSNNFNGLQCDGPNSLILVKKAWKHVGDNSSVVIVFVVDVAGPYFDVFKKLLSDFDVGIVDESCQVVYIVGGFVEIFDGNWVGVSESHQIFKYKGVVFPEATPQYGRQGVQACYPYFWFFWHQRQQDSSAHDLSVVEEDHLKGFAEEFKHLTGWFLYLRGWVHDECPKDIDNLIQFIPDVVFLNKRQYSLHECAIEHSHFFTVFQQFNEHFRFLTGSRPHLLWDIVDSLQISAVGAIGQHCEYIG